MAMETTGVGVYLHVPTGRNFYADKASSTHFSASDNDADSVNYARISFSKTREETKDGHTVDSRAQVRLIPYQVGTKDEPYNLTGRLQESVYVMRELVECKERSHVSLHMSFAFSEIYTARYTPEFVRVDDTHTKPGKRELQSNVPVTALLPDGVTWYTDRVVIQYTTPGLSILGMEWSAKLKLALFYIDSTFSLDVTLQEETTSVDIPFSIITQAGAGGAGVLVTLVDEELLNIEPITLFTFGPLVLEFQPGMRWTSKIKWLLHYNRVYFALRNALSLYGDVLLSTGCMVFIKISLGIRITASLMSNEYQFGLFSADEGTHIVEALVNGAACLELRYARIPFYISINPVCRVCVGFLRCRACVNCLQGILSSLSVMIFFGSQQTDILWTTCNEDGTASLIALPPSAPFPPLAPPHPPTVPDELENCHAHQCNPDLECTYLGPLWICDGGY